LIESGKQQQQVEQDVEQVEADSGSGSRTQVITVSGVIAALAFGYLICKVLANTSTKHCCQPSSPPDGDERRQQQRQVEQAETTMAQVSQSVSTPHKPLLPLIESTGVVNME